MEYVNCNLCKNDTTWLLFQAEDLNQGTGGIFNIVQCKNCGLVYLNPRPTKEELNRFYPEQYFRVDNWQSENSSPDFPRAKKILALKRKGRILDIGCKKGEFLAAFKERGWEALGIDISPKACDFARKRFGLNIIAADLLEIDLPPNYFDIISLHSTLEHLLFPLETLRTVNRLLKSDGLLYVALPNFNSFQARFFKEKWLHLDVPRHCYQFTPKTIKKMLRESGFRVTRINHFCFWQNFVGLRISILNLLHLNKPIRNKEKGNGGRMFDKNFFKSLLKFFFNYAVRTLSLLAALFKSGGAIEIYARKKDEKKDRNR